MRPWPYCPKVLTVDDVIASGACRDGVYAFIEENRITATAVSAKALVRKYPEKENISEAAGFSGFGDGDSYGDGDGFGDGYGDGDGYGYGFGYGDGDGYGDGYGDGFGDGYGYGDGDGYGYGYGDGDGFGYGYGFGDGYQLEG